MRVASAEVKAMSPCCSSGGQALEELTFDELQQRCHVRGYARKSKAQMIELVKGRVHAPPGAVACPPRPLACAPLHRTCSPTLTASALPALLSMVCTRLEDAAQPSQVLAPRALPRKRAARPSRPHCRCRSTDPPLDRLWHDAASTWMPRDCWLCPCLKLVAADSWNSWCVT